MVETSCTSLLRRQILRLPAVKAITGLSRSTIYAFIAAGSFPAPIPLGRRAVGWDAAEIDSWIEARLTQARKTGNRQHHIAGGQ